MTEAEYFKRAEDAFYEGDLGTSVINLKNALQQNPDSIGSRWLLGQVYIAQGDGAAAEKELNRAMTLGMQAEAVLPALGEALLLQGAYERLLNDIRISAGMNPGQKAKIMVLYGSAHMALNRMEEAEQAFQSALRDEPEAVNALVGLARIAKSRGDRAEAEALVARALTLAPDDPDVIAVRADMAYEAGDYSAAVADYLKVIEARPTQALYRLGLTRALINDGRDQDAIEHLTLLLKAAPNHPEANYLRAFAAYRAQDYQMAKLHAQKVLNAAPAHLPTLLIAGAAAYSLNEFEQANNFLEQVLSWEPANQPARRLLAATQFKLGLKDRALATLQPVVDSGDDAKALTLVSALLAQSGDFTAGQRYLRQAVALQPADAPTQALLDSTETLLKEPAEREDAASADAALRQDVKAILDDLNNKRIEQALEGAGRLLERHPDHFMPYNLLAAAHMAKGDEAQARKILEQGLEAAPGNPVLLHNLAGLAQRRGKPQEARGYYQEVLKHHPGHMQTLLALAALEDDQDEGGVATAALEQAVKANPQALQPRVLLARRLRLSGQPSQAMDVLRPVLGAGAGNPVFLAELGQTQLAAGEAAEAVRSLENLGALIPGSSRAAFLLAQAYAAAGDEPGLRRALEKTLDLAPDHLAARLALSRYLLKTGEWEQAARLIDGLERDQTGGLETTALRGELALGQGRHQDAAAAFGTLLEQAPDRKWAIRLSQAQLAGGAPEAATDTLANWLRTHPDDMLVMGALAERHMNQQRPEQALELYRELLRRQPDNPVVLNNLAWLLHRDQPEEALGYAERALELAPDVPAVLDTAGLLLLRQGEAERALALLRRAVQAVPDNRDFAVHLAEALVRSNQRDDARRLLEAALADESPFGERQRAAELLDDLNR